MSKKTRNRFSVPEKVAILRLHLLEHTPVSDLCDQHGIHPTMFYRWQKEFFENAAAAFEHRSRRPSDDKDRRIALLEQKLQRKHEVLSELMEEHIETVAMLPGDLGLIPIAEALKSATSRAEGKPNVIARGPEPYSPGISRARSRIGPGSLAIVSTLVVVHRRDRGA